MLKFWPKQPIDQRYNRLGLAWGIPGLILWLVALGVGISWLGATGAILIGIGTLYTIRAIFGRVRILDILLDVLVVVTLILKAMKQH